MSRHAPQLRTSIPIHRIHGPHQVYHLAAILPANQYGVSESRAVVVALPPLGLRFWRGSVCELEDKVIVVICTGMDTVARQFLLA